MTATIIDRLENYFGIPFPFEKCDNVSIPLTFGFGAMENAGMVTYAQNLILSDPAIDTISASALMPAWPPTSSPISGPAIW